MADAKIQIKDASGNVVLTIDRRITRDLGEIAIASGSSGSITVPEFANGQPFAFFLADIEFFATQTGFNMLNITISGTTLSWQFGTTKTTTGGFSSTNPSGTLVYGTY